MHVQMIDVRIAHRSAAKHLTTGQQDFRAIFYLLQQELQRNNEFIPNEIERFEDGK